MELLLALDFVTISEAKKILAEVGNGIDIVEVGTPFVVREGIAAVSEIKKDFPHLRVMADLKIMDAADYEAKMAFAAGADIVTVLGVADDATITAALTQARRFDRIIMIDMIGVKNIEARAKEVDALGVDYICVHTAFDIQGTGRNSLDDLRKIKRVVTHAKTAVAGGIRLETIDGIAQAAPDIVIVGAGITAQSDRRQAALALKKAMGHRGEANE